MPHATPDRGATRRGGDAAGRDPLTDALRETLGAAHVLVDDDVRAPFETDWTRRFGGRARLVARPGSTEEVAATVRACAELGVGVVPQGGNTGLVGGGVPREGEPVVLSLTRLNALEPVDPATAQVTAGAGATLAALHAHARASDLDAGLDFGARDTATLGGIVAADAGGARALRHGTARARVAGLEAVLANGETVTRLGGLLKDNAGYDLPALLVGSEGTLGIITRIRWRLVPRLPARVAALVPLPSAQAAADLLTHLRALDSLESADFMLDDGLGLVLDHLGVSAPVSERAPVYVLAECAARSDPTADLAEALEAAGIEDAVVADDTASRERLWRLREGHAEAIAAAGVPHKLDVGVPLGALDEFLARAREAVAPARAILFGHLGDGNVHVNVLGAAPDDPAVDEAVLTLAAELGGTISAEHGVGAAKAGWLHLVRSPADIAAMRAIKHALDPHGLLNPGVLLSARTAPPGRGDPAGAPGSPAARA